MKRPIRIGNCSGFFGDRISAAAELVDSGEIDVLTGDWLAELTMLILARQRMKHGPGSGYARTFLTQMEQVLGTCLDRGIPVVSNAGGLDPVGCAQALAALAERLGLAPKIGVVSGDDVLANVRADPGRFVNLDTGEPLGSEPVLTANAYIGGGPVAAALSAGADVVITGRITDAALVVGPAAWWHEWAWPKSNAPESEALDRLAGAVVAGHIIECGTQATGGNYSFFEEVQTWPPGFPIAEVAADGSSVITKARASGGLVNLGTVTAQLVYEIAGREYPNPDVTALFDTVQLAQVGPDRVAVTGARGAFPPEQLKVAINLFAGYRNTMSLVLTGSSARAKADLALQMIAGVGLDAALSTSNPRALAKLSELNVSQLSVAFEDVAASDPRSTAAAQGHLRITVKDADQKSVGKPFTSAIVESALASYPGMFPTAPPGDGTPFGVFWPTLIERSQVSVEVSVDGRTVAWTDPLVALAGNAEAGHSSSPPTPKAGEPGPARDPHPAWFPRDGATLGEVVGARSGDKGGNANVGVWVPAPGEGCSAGLSDAEVDARYQWLRDWLIPQRIQALLPETAELDVQVHAFPNLRAINVVIGGFLGRGVADSTSLDPQAKGLGEHLRALVIR